MKSKFTAIILSLLLLFSFVSCSAENVQSNSTGQGYTKDDNALAVHFIDVGQGDSEFIEFPNGKNMLIDAGEQDAGETVVSYLKKINVQSIDFVVATHPHSDHIGGLPAVFDAFDIKTVYMPNAVSDSYTFELLLDKIEAEGCETIEAKQGVSVIDDENLTAQFLAPVSEKYDDLNNYSAVLKITYIDKSFLFMGDAETLSENEITDDISADVIKVGHHGSNTSSSKSFINRVMPEIAVFEVGKDNSYGHPNKEVIERYENIGAEIMRTDLMGTIVLSTDGYSINDMSDRVITESDTKISAESTETAEYKYVLNTNSKKIHSSDCPSVSNISPKNKELTNETIEELEKQGYTCCKSCNPKG